MIAQERQPAVCPVHGSAFQRDTCAACNSAYMRGYLRRRRVDDPEAEMLSRARERATKRSLPFNLDRTDVAIPAVCPALGISIVTGRSRSDHSPSLDRIQPYMGYIKGNVRVLSDKANRLKGGRGAAELRLIAASCDPKHRPDYELLIKYVEREILLWEVKQRARRAGKEGNEWKKVADFISELFDHYGK